MAPQHKRRQRPAITLTHTDHERLSRLAESVSDRNPAVAGQLLDELDRARLVEDRRLPASVVRMGSTLSFATDTGETRTVTLVFPGEADIEAGRISILTPIGAALIGLAAGQSIDWTGRDGRVHRLTVEAVGDGAPAAGERAAS